MTRLATRTRALRAAALLVAILLVSFVHLESVRFGDRELDRYPLPTWVVAPAEAAGQPTGFVGPILLIPPLGNGLDDSGRLNAALLRANVQTSAGTYVIAAPWSLTSNRTITLHPLTVLSSSITADPLNVAAAPIVALPFAVPGGVATTITAAAKIGDTSVSTVAAMPPATACMGAGNTVQCFDVISSTGGGPYTTTISKPIVLAQPIGTAVSSVGRVHDVTIYGNGAWLVGSGSCGIELPKVDSVVIRNLHVRGTWTQKAASLDVGSSRSGFEDLDVNSGNTAGQIGVSWEGCDRCWGTRVTAYNSGAGVQAMWADNVTGLELNDCDAHGAGSYGLQWTTSPQSGSVVRGGSYSYNTGSGIIISGSTGIKIDGATVRTHPGYGVYLWSDVDDISIANATLIDNWNGGLYVLGGNVHVTNLYTKWTAATGVYQTYGVKIGLPSLVTITGWTDAQVYYSPLYVGAAATVRVIGFNWPAVTASGAWIGADIEAAATVSLRSGTIGLGTVANAIGVNAGVGGASVFADDVLVTGTPSGGNGFKGAATWRYGMGLTNASGWATSGSETTVTTSAGHP